MSTILKENDITANTTPNGHGLGWKVQPTDARDFIFAVRKTTKAKPIPRKVDLTKTGLLPAPKNQGPYGSCVAHSTAANIEYLMAKAIENVNPVSRAEIYWYARLLSGLQNE